jgi:dihydrofolate reductase
MTKQLSLICAMSRNHVIGIKNDLEHFKNLTKGKPIIMGRLTYQSILARRKGKPLPHRPHYVVSSQDLGALPDGVQVLKSLTDAIDTARQDYPDMDIMIIGGASIYEQSVPLVDKMYLTMIDTDIDGDAFFPRFDTADWREAGVEAFTDPIPFRFITFERKVV